MNWLHKLIPSPQDVLNLEPEQLAAIMLAQWNTNRDTEVQLNRYNVGGSEYYVGYGAVRAEIQYAIMEAWMCLEAKCLVAPKPETTGSWYFITRRGKKLKSREEIEQYLLGRNMYTER